MCNNWLIYFVPKHREEYKGSTGRNLHSILGSLRLKRRRKHKSFSRAADFTVHHCSSLYKDIKANWRQTKLRANYSKSGLAHKASRRFRNLKLWRVEGYKSKLLDFCESTTTKCRLATIHKVQSLFSIRPFKLNININNAKLTPRKLERSHAEPYDPQTTCK